MRYLRLAVGLLLFAHLLPATVISGQIINLTGQITTSNRSVQFTLQNCGANMPVVVGSSVIVPASYTYVPNPAGLAGTVVGNDIISCGTTVGQTYYQVTIFAGTQQVCQQTVLH